MSKLVARLPEIDPKVFLMKGRGFKVDEETGEEEYEGPIFTVSEVGKIFFARSSHWMRLMERMGFTVKGEKVTVPRSDGGTGVRQFTLHDVELVAHALGESGRIDPTQLVKALRTVQTIADVWGFLDEG